MSAVRAARVRLFCSSALQMFHAWLIVLTDRASSWSSVWALLNDGASIVAWPTSGRGLAYCSPEPAEPWMSEGIWDMGQVSFSQRGGVSGHCSDERRILALMKQAQ